MNDVTRVTPAEGFGETLMQVLKDPSISADKLQVVLQMQREILADRRVEAFKTAFVQASAEMPRVNKNGLIELIKNGVKVGSYRYAKWEDMDEVLRPHLQKFGLALSFSETPAANGHVQLRGELMHIDGHSIYSERNMPPDTGPGRNALQAQGSSISYGKRYIAEELCNIVRVGIDDDGRSAVSTPISEKQAAELVALLKKIKTSPQTFLRLFVTGCDSVEEIQVRDYPRLINALNEKLAAMTSEKGSEK